MADGEQQNTGSGSPAGQQTAPQGEGQASAPDFSNSMFGGVTQQTSTGQDDGQQQQRDGATRGSPSAASQQAETQTSLVYKERPEWLPEVFYDKKTGALDVERMAKEYTHYRGLVSSKMHTAPDKPDGYTLDPPKNDPTIQAAIETLLPDGDKDPVLQAVRTAAHSAGVSKAQFQAITNAFLAAQGQILPEPIVIEQEIKKLGPKGPAMIKAQLDLVNTQLRIGNFTQDEAERIGSWLMTADDIQTMRKLLEVGGVVPHIDTQAMEMAAGGEDAAVLRAEMGKLLQEPSTPETQKKYEKLMERYLKLYGTEPQRTSSAA